MDGQVGQSLGPKALGVFHQSVDLLSGHAGLAYGLDRVIMLMVGADSIRDVIAFPKVKDASCLMMEAPSEVDVKQLEELHIAVVPEEKEQE